MLLSLIKPMLRPAILQFTERVSHIPHLKYSFKKYYGYKLPLHNPRTHSEKIFRRKAHYTDDMTYMSDKASAKDYVAKTFGESYVIPSYGVVDTLTREFYESLPDSFVIKATHGSAFNIIVQNKADYPYEDLKRITDTWLNTKFHMLYLEFHYKGVKPRLIAEKLLTDSTGRVPKDYKCNYFDNNNNPIIYIHVVTDRFGDIRIDYFNEKWTVQNITLNEHNSDQPETIPPPKNLQKMIDITKELARPYAFVRVDFFEFNGQLYFGEMTFTPNAGFHNFISGTHHETEWGALWGSQKIQ